MSKESITASFSMKLQHAIDAADLPNGFYDSFAFTKTGNNLCHPITVWMIGNAVAQIDGVVCVGIDVRLNNLGDRIKFQPDVVGFGKGLSHVLYVDFESPNSCDARIANKDVQPYLRWTATHNDAANYIIVTSVPDREIPDWELRYISHLNAEHKGRRAAIRKNPLRYWTAIWRRDLAGCNLSRVALLNIDGRSVQRVNFP